MKTDLNEKNTTFGINLPQKKPEKCSFALLRCCRAQRVGLLRSHYVTTAKLALRLGGAQYYTTPGAKRGRYLYYLILYVHKT